MLNKLRGFSNSKLAMVVVGIIIIPFVFWGMGSVFSGGNTNNVAKINKETISTKDFVDFINQTKLTNEFIKKNIDKNILEDALELLVSEKISKLEIEDLNLSISENSLANMIKSNAMFLDENKKFSRNKYEKYMMENKISHVRFEKNFKEQKLNNNLLNYMFGGIKSPYFLNNKIFINETKKIEIDYFDINQILNKVTSNSEINEFIKENEEALKEDFIDFSYIKISPIDLVEINEFNDTFFKKIDDIENDILNGLTIDQIKKKYDFNLTTLNNFKNNKTSDKILNFIYTKRNDDKIQIIDKNEYFLLYEIKKINKILPNKSDSNFIKLIKDNLIYNRTLDLYSELYKKIESKKLNNDEFIKIAKDIKNIKSTTINNINDNNTFDIESIKSIYLQPKQSFILIKGNEKKKIFLAKIKNIYTNNINKNNPRIKDYLAKSNNEIIGEISNSYNLLLGSKYKITYFQNSLERVKNYFR